MVSNISLTQVVLAAGCAFTQESVILSTFLMLAHVFVLKWSLCKQGLRPQFDFLD